MDWSGDHRSCDPGEVSSEYQDSVEQQINFFRAMAGVPADVELIEEYNAKAQEAALLMSKNVRLSHFPPEGWSCYTEVAAEAAGSSNLLLGTHGAHAISRYMLDPGADNADDETDTLWFIVGVGTTVYITYVVCVQSSSLEEQQHQQLHLGQYQAHRKRRRKTTTTK